MSTEDNSSLDALTGRQRLRVKPKHRYLRYLDSKNFMSIKELATSKFNPTLSWDGVAMLTACVLCCIWFGTLKETVRQQGEAIRHHDQVIESLSEGMKLISQNIAVLQTLVNERTGAVKAKP